VFLDFAVFVSDVEDAVHDKPDASALVGVHNDLDLLSFRSRLRGARTAGLLAALRESGGEVD
jgi:hypothetical protein